MPGYNQHAYPIKCHSDGRFVCWLIVTEGIAQKNPCGDCLTANSVLGERDGKGIRRASLKGCFAAKTPLSMTIRGVGSWAAGGAEMGDELLGQVNHVLGAGAVVLEVGQGGLGVQQGIGQPP